MNLRLAGQLFLPFELRGRDSLPHLKALVTTLFHSRWGNLAHFDRKICLLLFPCPATLRQYFTLHQTPTQPIEWQPLSCFNYPGYLDRTAKIILSHVTKRDDTSYGSAVVRSHAPSFGAIRILQGAHPRGKLISLHAAGNIGEVGKEACVINKIEIRPIDALLRSLKIATLSIILIFLALSNFLIYLVGSIYLVGLFSL